MIVGRAQLELYIPDAQSLKEKRMILRSLITRIQNKFNAAVAEVSAQDLWQRAEIGIAVVSADSKHADSQLQSIIRFVENNPNVQLIEVDTDID